MLNKELLRRGRVEGSATSSSTGTGQVGPVNVLAVVLLLRSSNCTTGNKLH